MHKPKAGISGKEKGRKGSGQMPTAQEKQPNWLERNAFNLLYLVVALVAVGIAFYAAWQAERAYTISSKPTWILRMHTQIFQ